MNNKQQWPLLDFNRRSLALKTTCKIGHVLSRRWADFFRHNHSRLCRGKELSAIESHAASTNLEMQEPDGKNWNNYVYFFLFSCLAVQLLHWPYFELIMLCFPKIDENFHLYWCMECSTHEYSWSWQESHPTVPFLLPFQVISVTLSPSQGHMRLKVKQQDTFEQSFITSCAIQNGLFHFQPKLHLLANASASSLGWKWDRPFCIAHDEV